MEIAAGRNIAKELSIQKPVPLNDVTLTAVMDHRHAFPLRIQMNYSSIERGSHEAQDHVLQCLLFPTSKGDL
jgi:hypothetical protein